MTNQKETEEEILTDKLYLEPCNCRKARRNVCEALRRIRDWFNRNFQAQENIPKEFESFMQPDDPTKFAPTWNKYL